MQLEDIKGHMKGSADSIQKDISAEDDPISIQRREKVKDAMLHAWTSYEKYAWGKDELKVFHNFVFFVYAFLDVRVLCLLHALLLLSF